jgi:hypothetical protein
MRRNRAGRDEVQVKIAAPNKIEVQIDTDHEIRPRGYDMTLALRRQVQAAVAVLRDGGSTTPPRRLITPWFRRWYGLVLNYTHPVAENKGR